jgi:hypothetical protein
MLALSHQMVLSPFPHPIPAFTEARGHPGNAVVSQHQIGRKSNLERVGAFVIERLVESAYAAINNSFYRLALATARVSPA